VINKGNTESDLERAVKNAFSTGRQSLKLYFMIGLPTETDEDLEGIAELVLKVKRWAPKIKVTASVSTFVPKSHTPFQWAQQISMEETLRRQDVIRSILKRARVGLKFHSPRLSFLEGVLARGDERLGRVIMKAYYLGARFDGWDDQFRLPIWLEALSSERIDPLEFLSSRPVEGSLPWDFIDSGVRKEFLAKEWDRAHGLESTPDCRTEGCSGCGVCDFKEKRLRFSSTSETKSTEPLNTEPISIRRFRLKYAKLGHMSFIGHQDLIRIYERAFRRSGLELAYSQGFHPHPKLRFSPPVAFGVESHAEFLDFDLINCDKAPETLSTELSKALPEGITPMSFGEISLSEQRLSSKIWRVFYRVYLTEGSDDKFSEKISRFLDSEEFLLSRKKKGKTFEMDLRSRVLDMNYSNGTLSFSCLVKQAGSVHPYEAIAAILGMSREDALKYRVVKTDAIQVEE
jgi:radical SAM-linked protein